MIDWKRLGSVLFGAITVVLIWSVLDRGLFNNHYNFDYYNGVFFAFICGAYSPYSRI